MKKKYLFLFLFFGVYQANFAQHVKLSVYSEISILTVGPGEELFEAFGHSAIRVKDPVLNFDLVYNYGMFDFNAPNFYSNFTKGKLIYKVARYPFRIFDQSNKKDKRWMKQQVLNLDVEERQEFFEYLEINVKPENASYFYDPYFNNCATKLRDIAKIILGDKFVLNSNHLKEERSLRQLMNKEIHWNTWGSFGINLALGSVLDKKIMSEEYMYLPDYVYSAFENASIFKNNQPEKIVKKDEVLLDFKEKEQKIIILNPFLIFSLIAIFGLYMSYKDFKTKRRSKWLDFSLFLSTGIIGSFIVFLWFFTDHSTTPNNFNFLWAFAINLLVSFIILKNQQKKWVHYYLFLLIAFLLFIPIIWIVGIQDFPIAITPFLMLLLIRYLLLANGLLTFKK